MQFDGKCISRMNGLKGRGAYTSRQTNRFPDNGPEAHSSGAYLVRCELRYDDVAGVSERNAAPVERRVIQVFPLRICAYKNTHKCSDEGL